MSDPVFDQQNAAYVLEGTREIGHDFIGHQFECTKSPLGLKLFLVLAMAGEDNAAWEALERARLTRF